MDANDRSCGRRHPPVLLRPLQPDRVVDYRLANPDKPMADCIETVGGPGEQRGSTARRRYELAANLKDEFDRWNVLGAALVRRVDATSP